MDEKDLAKISAAIDACNTYFNAMVDLSGFNTMDGVYVETNTYPTINIYTDDNDIIGVVAFGDWGSYGYFPKGHETYNEVVNG